MARYKETNKKQGQFIPVIFEEQILPGTIEYAICDIIDNHVDTSVFDEKYKNDETVAPAFPPGILLKIILVCYSKGIVTSRKIEEAVKRNVTLMAVAEGMEPDHSTIAAFVASMGDVINKLFVDVLLCCAQLDLVGGEVFALDGCKIKSNAAKEYSGTFKELEKKKEKLSKMLKELMNKHLQGDKKPDAMEKRKRKYENSPFLIKRDFDRKYKIIDNQVNNLHKRNFRKYKEVMIKKYKRGIKKRDIAIQSKG